MDLTGQGKRVDMVPVRRASVEGDHQGAPQARLPPLTEPDIFLVDKGSRLEPGEEVLADDWRRRLAAAPHPGPDRGDRT